MHPFIQHFNNIAKPSTLLTSFEQCSTLLLNLTTLLHIPTLSTLQLQIPPINFPGFTKITFSQLKTVWEHFSASQLDQKSSNAQLTLQAQSILSTLSALRRYVNSTDEPLLSAAQSFEFTHGYKQLSGAGDVSFEVKKLKFSLFGNDEIGEEKFYSFFDKLETSFAELQQIGRVVSNKEQSLLENVNFMLKMQNLGQIGFYEVPPHGCEIQLQESELLALSKLVQFYLCPGGRKIGTNCLAVMQNVVEQIEGIVGQPVVFGLFQMMLGSAEQQLFSVQEVDKEHFMSFMLLMLNGRLHIYTEDEFYVQAVRSCDAVVRIIQWAFPQSVQYKTFQEVFQWFRHFIKPYFHDKIHDYKNIKYKNVEFFDADLKKLIKDIGGVKDSFGFIFKTWLMCKSLFQNSRSILQSLALFLYEIKRPNGSCIEKKQFLSLQAQQIDIIGDEYDVDVILSQVGLMMIK